MVYNPATDFLALWRASGGAVSKVEMPGLDYVVAALGRAGVINVIVQAAAPIANQSTTAWFQTAVPGYSAEGVLRLWDATAATYAAATPRLFFEFLQASSSQSGVSWWTSIGGPPLNTVGNDGDFAIRLDDVGGIYGPKVLGAWPADPIPGSTNTIDQAALDNTFGDARGSLVVRGALQWVALPKGDANDVLAAGADDTAWSTLTALLDAVFSNAHGAVMYRGAAAWAALGPGTEDRVLTTHGAGADPTWTPKSSEFSPGTVMLFRQTNAPTGWTKQLSVDNYGLRVTNGTVGTTAGSPFSTVFSQTATGNTTLIIDTMPAHHHNTDGDFSPVQAGVTATAIIASGGRSTSITGGNNGHSHSVNLSLAYVDVIIATKD